MQSLMWKLSNTVSCWTLYDTLLFVSDVATWQSGVEHTQYAHCNLDGARGAHAVGYESCRLSSYCCNHSLNDARSFFAHEETRCVYSGGRILAGELHPFCLTGHVSG